MRNSARFFGGRSVDSAHSSWILRPDHRVRGGNIPLQAEGYATTMHVKLQKIIGYEFKNPDLLTEALTHPSIAHERATESNHHNQRLEFLGDAVLQLVVTDRIYKMYPDQPEGKLTQIRAHLANR